MKTNDNAAPDTSATHTTINLVPGLDLMVHKDHVDNPVTLRLVDACKDLLDIADHQKSILYAVDVLEKEATDEAFDGLDSILEMTGWLSNLEGRTHAEMAAGIRALLSIATADDVLDIYQTAQGELYKAWARREMTGEPKEIA